MIFSILLKLINLYTLLIVIWAAFSWFPYRRNRVATQIFKVLDTIVGPYVRIFQRFLPTFGGFDFSPWLALIVLQLVMRALFWLI